MAYFRIYDGAGFGFGPGVVDLFDSVPAFREMEDEPLTNNRVRFTARLDGGLDFELVAAKLNGTITITFIEFSKDESPILTLSGIRFASNDNTAWVRAFNGPDEIVGNRYADIFNAEGGSDIVRGKGGNDRLLGGYGDDRLFGGYGDDRLFGDSGADRLNGGRGQDRLDAGLDGAADVIVFRSATDSAVGARHDIVLNFDRDDDRIDLSGLDAHLRTMGNDDFIWGGRTRGDGRVWWTAASEGVLLKGDLGGDGDVRPDFEILLFGLGSLGRDDVLL